jgi:hypothetical protein
LLFFNDLDEIKVFKRGKRVPSGHQMESKRQSLTDCQRQSV